jgi:hypothetical protein
MQFILTANLQRSKWLRLESLRRNSQIFVGHGFSRAVKYAESMWL